MTIDNRLLNEGRSEGLFLQLERLLQMENGNPQPVQTFSIARSRPASSDLVGMLPAASWSAAGKRAKGKGNQNPRLKTAAGVCSSDMPESGKYRSLICLDWEP